jgi:hypothetical protein
MNDRHILFVGTKAYGVWHSELPRRNAAWLRAFDPAHFQYLAGVHKRRLRSTHAQDAALALRTAYGIGLESFFALVGAMVQAPHAAFVWLDLYQLDDLRQVVRSFRGGKAVPKLFLPPLSWSALSEEVHGSLNEAKVRERWVKPFADFWERAAADFLDLSSTAEYNAVKHGFRVQAGGFALAIGRQDAPGVPAPRGRMSRLDSGGFGGRTMRTQRIGRHRSDFGIVTESRSWDPEAYAVRLNLLAMSMNNIVMKLRALAPHAPSETGILLRPHKAKDFESAWESRATLTSFKMASNIRHEDIDPTTETEVAATYGLTPTQLAEIRAGHTRARPR